MTGRCRCVAGARARKQGQRDDLVSITLTCPDPEIDDTIPDHADWTDPRLQRQRLVEVEGGTLERFMRLQWALPSEPWSEHDLFGPLSDACQRTM